MLIYHPIYDVNHCVYRTLMILELSEHTNFDIELFRLIDFYVLFPHFMKHIKPLPAELRSFKKIIQRIPEPYESIKNVKRILYELESIQTVAIQNLLAKNLIDIESFKHKKLMRTKTELPANIKQNMKSSNVFNEEWFRLLINEIPLLNFLGKKGLKSRAGLMEYRYDLEKV